MTTMATSNETGKLVGWLAVGLNEIASQLAPTCGQAIAWLLLLLLLLILVHELDLARGSLHAFVVLRS